MAPDVNTGIAEGDESGKTPLPESFGFTDSELAALGGRAMTEAPESKTPWADKSQDIAASVAAPDDGSLTLDVQRGLEAGRAGKPAESKPPALEGIGSVRIGDAEVSGEQVSQALAAAEELAEQADFQASEDAVELFLDAVEEAGGDGGALVMAAADLNVAIEAGTVSLEEAGSLIREALLDSYAVFESDLEDDPELAETIEEAFVELVNAAAQVAEIKQANEDQEAAAALVGPAAKARGKQLVDSARSFARQKGITTDAEGVRRFNEASPLAEDLYRERTGFAVDDPRHSLDPDLYTECLIASDAANVEDEKAQRTRAFHEQLIGSDFNAGWTSWGRKIDLPTLTEQPKLDERKVVARAAMRHSSAKEIRSALLDTPSTDIEAGLRQGRS